MRIAIVLSLGLCVVSLMRRQAAATRHWTLAVTIACAAILPALGAIAPAWEWPGRGEPVAGSVAVVGTIYGPTDCGGIDDGAVGERARPDLVSHQSVAEPAPLDGRGARPHLLADRPGSTRWDRATGHAGHLGAGVGALERSARGVGD